MYLKICFIVFINFMNYNEVDAIQTYNNIERRRQTSKFLKDILPRFTRRIMPNIEISGHDNRIIGVPSSAYHLPEAEPILPGHTLLRPAFGMLKSSIKFPHREMEDGAGVLGNVNNLGLKWDGRNERLLYSSFRRSPGDYIMIAPSKPAGERNPRFAVSSIVLDDEKQDVSNKRLKKHLEDLWKPYSGDISVSSVILELNKKRAPKKRAQKQQDNLWGPIKGNTIVLFSSPPEKKFRSTLADEKSFYLQDLDNDRNLKIRNLLKRLLMKSEIKRRGSKIIQNSSSSSRESIELPKSTTERHWIWETKSDGAAGAGMDESGAGLHTLSTPHLGRLLDDVQLAVALRLASVTSKNSPTKAAYKKRF